jgi:hypothetical protein
VRYSIRRTGHQARPLDILIDPVVDTGRATAFGSGFEGNKAPESRVREAVPSGFDVTRQPVLESRISCDRDDKVVPAIELIQRQLAFKRIPKYIRINDGTVLSDASRSLKKRLMIELWSQSQTMRSRS